jgi:ribosomal protein L21
MMQSPLITSAKDKDVIYIKNMARQNESSRTCHRREKTILN